MSRLRVATAADLPALIDLDALVFGADAWSSASWAAELEQMPATRHVEVLSNGDGTLLAYVVLRAVGDVADLQRIAVAAPARRAGRARELLDAALSVARHRGCARVLLEVAADNVAAIALYRAAGFEPLHRRLNYYGSGRDALILQLAQL